MRKAIVWPYVTLDGVMQAPEKWFLQFRNEEAAKHAHDQLLGSDALLLARVTYQGFAAAWSSRTGDDVADRMNSLPKYVALTTLEEAEWDSSSLIKGNVAEGVSKLEQRPGEDLLLYGSAELIHTLMRHDLIDEYRIWITPIVVGSGKRSFRDGSATTTMRLVDTRRPVRASLSLPASQQERRVRDKRKWDVATPFSSGSWSLGIFANRL